MPLLVSQRRLSPAAKSRSHRRRRSPPPSSPPSPPPALALERHCRVLCLLWRRALASYLEFHQSEAPPFITAAAPPPESPLSDAQWAAVLPGGDPAAALIAHLHAVHEALDGSAWLVALCLLERLHLRYFVQARVRQMRLFSQEEGDASEAVQPVAAAGLCHALFTLYCIAFKAQMDFPVTLRYLVRVFAFSGGAAARVVAATVAREAALLRQLEYRCWVPRVEVDALLRHFLGPAERDAIADIF